ncbi:MAG TPA: aminoglycoside phosphotransferase family protein [Actinopolymorphaceae bacterium]|nr:aminoglycoside phosphotransferase family protein [Actinopolymorphaceae bacterium]
MGELTATQLHASRVIAQSCGEPAEVWPHLTWRPQSVVVGARLADGAQVALKASGHHSVWAEANTLRMAAAAGVPVPPVLDEGEAEGLPGGRWMLIRKARGRPWALPTPNVRASARTQADLGRIFALLHACKLPGYGPLDENGEGGYARWSDFLRQTLVEPLRFLHTGGHLDGELVTRVERLFSSQAPMLDNRPAVFVHGDLGNMEIFVDRRNRVVDIIDFGDAVVGDPLYDFAHFVRGGPADDPRSAAILPGVRRSYAAHGGAEPRNWDQLFWIYDIFNAVRNVEFSVQVGLPWVSGLRTKIVQLLDQIDDCHALH